MRAAVVLSPSVLLLMKIAGVGTVAVPAFRVLGPLAAAAVNMMDHAAARASGSAVM